VSIRHRNKRNPPPPGGIGLTVNLPWDPEVKSLQSPGTATWTCYPQDRPNPSHLANHYLPLERKVTKTTTARAANKMTATIGSDISAIIIRLSSCCLRVAGRYHPRLPERKALGLYTGVLLSLTASQVREPHRPRP
jgi:hypothetical protein